MFKKAVQDHSGQAKPLQPNVSRLNASAPSPSNPPPQSAGAKRKLETADAGQSTLNSLHSAVYFDENDFDDDDELDLESPDPFPPPKVAPARQSTQESFKYPLIKEPSTTHASSTQDNGPSKGGSSSTSTTQTDIKYPELPPVAENDGSPQEPAPSSSIQIPWSSSPPSHMLPPTKRRTLPWLDSESANDKTAGDEGDDNKGTSTPAQSKPVYPWNKTVSAVKEEQKELRRQNKKRQQADAKPRLYKPRERVASLFLSDEQRGVLEAVVDQGKSIFFTGSAGTGKSVLMREIIKRLREKYRREPDRVAVTASTGLAACNIEGVTLHSFAGIGLGKEPVPELVKKVSSHRS